jgi:hypothetical protein
MLFWIVIASILLLFLIVILIVSLHDIRRYMKIRSM